MYMIRLEQCRNIYYKKSETGIEDIFPETCELTSWCECVGGWPDAQKGTHLQHPLLVFGVVLGPWMQEMNHTGIRRRKSPSKGDQVKKESLE